MRILVTGGAGFVGSHIVDRLIEQGHRVSVLDNFSTGRRELVHRAARVHRGDIRGRHVRALLSRLRPDVVVHAAAQASVTRSLADPVEDASVNLLGTVNLLESCRRTGIRRFVYISTGGAAYGDTDVIPTPEDHPMRPSSFYGVSKVAAERHVDCFGALTPIRTLTLRLANVYGPRQDPAGEAGVVAIFTARLLGGEPCVINDDGEQTRDFVYVGDVAEAVLRAVEHEDAGGAVNISTGTETTINALYQRLVDAVGVRRKARHGPARSGEQRRSALCSVRARTVLGWMPSTSLEAGLKLTVDSIRQPATDRPRRR